MPDVSFGGTDGAAVWGSPSAYSDGIPLPQGRAMANGSRAVAITALLGYVAGRGGGRTATLRLGSAETNGIYVAASTSEQSTGWQGVKSWWIVNGGSTRFTIDVSGSSYFGRSQSGTVVVYTTTYTGTLGGALRYVEAPTTPSSLTLSATSTPGELRIQWGAPSDDGGASITQYQAQVATNSSMSGATTYNLGTSGSYTLTGLTPGTTYYVRVAAINAVTASQSTTSTWTSVKSLALSAGAKVWNGTAWVNGTVKVWNGTAWVTAVVKVWTGTSWATAT